MTAHPAKFSDVILEAIYVMIEDETKRREWECPLLVLDPFAGVGRIHELGETWTEIDTIGVELEQEWADLHPFTIQGDSRDLPFEDDDIDIIATSPTYGNRMADHHEAKDDSKRITYRHQLGRPLTDGNTGALQFGSAYKRLHVEVYRECRRVLVPGGLFILNVSNHIRGGVEVDVTSWHIGLLERLGFTVEQRLQVPTPRMGFGANRSARVSFESVVALRFQS